MSEIPLKNMRTHPWRSAVPAIIAAGVVLGFQYLNAAKSEKAVWEESPGYFESYADLAAAKPWVEKALDSVIDAGIPLVYWWCYQSDRPVDQSNPQRFDITRERNPELIQCIIEANRRLKAKLTPGE